MLRLLLEGILEEAISIIINLYEIRLDSFTNIFSFAYCLLFMLIFTSLPIFIYKLLGSYRSILHDQEFEKKFGTLYENIRT